MNEFLVHLMSNVLRNSALLVLMSGLVAVALRLFKVASPTTRQIAYLAVVAQGCLLARLNVELPLLDATTINRQHEGTTDAEKQASNGLALQTSLQLAVDESHRSSQATATPAMTVRSSGQQVIPWARLFALAWVAGVVFLAGRTLRNYCRFWVNLPRELQPEPEWLTEWNQLQRSEGIRSPVPLYVTEHVGPMLCRGPDGYRLIVPVDHWSELQPTQRLAILRHELQHLLRGDVWKSLGIRVLALLQWFNPAVWWAVNRFDECAEWVCDEAAKQAEPALVADYARALLSLGNQSRVITLSSPAVKETRAFSENPQASLPKLTGGFQDEEGHPVYPDHRSLDNRLAERRSDGSGGSDSETVRQDR